MVLLCTVLLVTACGGGGSSSGTNTTNNSSNGSAEGSGNADSNEKTITFIHLNDLHAHLLPHWEQVRQENGKSLIRKQGGLARIATKIKQLRSENPQNILMNIGDTYHGGAEAMFSNGNVIVDLVNLLNIDVGVPGNWDYAYGPVVSNARYGNLTHSEVKRPNYQMLAANATYRIPPNITQPLAQSMVQRVFNYQAGDAFLPATQMIERDGIKIGFIGITSDIVERMHEMMAFNLAFTQGDTAYRNLIETHANALRQAGANVVVVMSELGIHKDWALAKSFNSKVVDVFFSAHTHETTTQALESSAGIVVVEAGNDTYLGQMDIKFDEQANIKSYEWTLHTIDHQIEDDAVMANAIQTARAPYVVDNPNLEIPLVTPADASVINNMLPSMFNQTLSHNLDSTLGKVVTPLDRRNALQNHFNNAFTDLLRSKANTDIALSPGFRFDSSVIPDQDQTNLADEEYYWETGNTWLTSDEGYYDLVSADDSNWLIGNNADWVAEDNVVLNGDFTVADAYRFFPAPYSLSTGQVTGGRLKQVIEENLNAVFSNNIFEQAGGWTDGFSGLNLTVDLSKTNGSRVLEMKRTDTGVDIADTDLLTVAGCSRPMDSSASTTLCSYTGFQNVTDFVNPSTNEAWAAADFLIEAVKKLDFQQLGITVRENIDDQNNTPMWPDSTFYQPLEGV